MALYVAVTTTTLIVSVLGLTALSIVRIERRHGTAINDRLEARTHSRSAVEWALRRIAADPNWRSTYANGIETTRTALGAGSAGTVSFSLADSDNDLTNPDVLLRLKGFGRVGAAVQVSSVEIQPGVVGPVQVRGQTVGIDTDNLDADEWWGQYFKPVLPADAIGWRVSAVELYCRRATAARVARVRLYRPQASYLPSATMIDEQTFSSDTVSTLWGWYAVALSGTYWLAPNEGVCMTLETASANSPIDIGFRNSGMAEADSAMFRGTPAWSAATASRALRYRVQGYYANSSGVHPIAGTWQWDTP